MRFLLLVLVCLFPILTAKLLRVTEERDAARAELKRIDDITIEIGRRNAEMLSDAVREGEIPCWLREEEERTFK